MERRPSPKVNSFSADMPRKALGPMITAPPELASVTRLQPWNAFSPISIRLSGSEISVNAVQL